MYTLAQLFLVHCWLHRHHCFPIDGPWTLSLSVLLNFHAVYDLYWVICNCGLSFCDSYPCCCHLPEMGKETGGNGRISVTIFIDTSPCNTPYLKCILLKTPQPNYVITQTVFFKIVMKLIATLWYKWICPIHNSCFSQVRTLTRRFYYWFNVFFKLVCYKMTDQ